ncbi:hypothetical protein AAFC00_000091 [Neodothiora populina]
MTLAGLNTVNLSQLNTWQQCMLFFLIIMGSAIFVSAFVVLVRKRAFERKFRSIIQQRKQKSRHSRSGSQRSFSLRRPLSRDRRNTSELEEVVMTGFERSQLGAKTLDDSTKPGFETTSKSTLGLRQGAAMPVDHPEDDLDSIHASSQADRITFSPDTRFASVQVQEPHRRRGSVFSAHGVGARPTAGLYPSTSHHSSASKSDMSELAQGRTNTYFPSSGFIARNSLFYGLSDAERDELGGVEYRAVSFLAWVVPLYFVLFQLLGCLGLAAYVAKNRPSTARTNGLNPYWVGAFNGVSAFNNSGMSLLDANMTAFQTSYYMMLTMGLMILAGNTCYPIFLRLAIWTMLKLIPKSESWNERRATLTFLLDHPRRCYTNLFPSKHTWWLLFVVVVLNGTDWAAFEILNIGNTKLESTLPVHIRVIDGLFQALAVRSGGFYVVSIPTLRISLQVLYVIMMYISVYPVVITMRNSNVYEERSLGIYADDPGYNGPGSDAASERPSSIWRGIKERLTSTGNAPESARYFVHQQLRAQHAHDAWWIVFAVFLIMIIEGGQFEKDPATFSVFNVIFEAVSAYGCVGISVGAPGVDYSFSGSLRTLSKLVLCAVMIRGRHRGLPVALDKAVLLPHERQNIAEEEDAMIRLERTRSHRQDDVV